MSPTLIGIVIVLYFGLLVFIAKLTSRNANNETFYVGNRQSKWYLVAFGMIGASLSGVTFLSIPGWVGNPGNQFSYMQVVFGYFLGYMVVAFVLMPIYYKMQLTSIYTYLEERFGYFTHKTGTFFFLGSRVLGSAIRLLLVANVLQTFLFDAWGVPFELTVFISIALIWVYTYKGGMKTIIWTDTLQTFFMIAAVLLIGHFIASDLDLYKTGLIKEIKNSQYSQIFFFDDPNAPNYFWKHFLGGMFITIGMTGLDQDMMQKNLTCKNIQQAQWNMTSFASVLILVNLIFLGLGALLYMYSAKTGIGAGVSGDILFPTIATHPSMEVMMGVFFIIGLVAAAYSSADSALAALTTSFSVDLLRLDKRTDIDTVKARKRVHLMVSVVLLLVIIILKYSTSQNAIDSIMFFAGFTYGPLIGLFFFGILTKYDLRDKWTPVVCVASACICIALWYYSAGGPGANANGTGILGKYKIGYELIIFNSVITFVNLFAIIKRKVA
jgi:solute:Na+ symporter, SSS family